MRPPSLFRRALIVALAIVQMAAPSVASVADASYAARSNQGAARAHIEDHTQRSCVPVHADNCALCQFLSHFSPVRAAAALVPVPAALCAPVPADEIVQPSAIARGHQRSRAPPIA